MDQEDCCQPGKVVMTMAWSLRIAIGWFSGRKEEVCEDSRTRQPARVERSLGCRPSPVRPPGWRARREGGSNTLQGLRLGGYTTLGEMQQSGTAMAVSVPS